MKGAKAMYKYHVAIWQNTVAPDDPGGTAQQVEDFLNELADQHWEIIQVDSLAMINNIFRVVAFCRKSGAVMKSEEAAAAGDPGVATNEPTPDEETETPSRGKRHR